MIKLVNDNLSRSLHSELYLRLHSFCSKYTPEIPAEIVVNSLLTRLYNNDPTLHIFVTLKNKYDNGIICEHAVVEIVNSYGHNIIYCHQLERDTPSVSAMNEFMELLDKLAAAVNAASIMFTVTEHSKAYQRKYNYQSVRYVMLKTLTNTNSE